jgi:hypothetical protein
MIWIIFTGRSLPLAHWYCSNNLFVIKLLLFPMHNRCLTQSHLLCLLPKFNRHTKKNSFANQTISFASYAAVIIQGRSLFWSVGTGTDLKSHRYPLSRLMVRAKPRYCHRSFILRWKLNLEAATHIIVARCDWSRQLYVLNDSRF